jgi:hypothetical protein
VILNEVLYVLVSVPRSSASPGQHDPPTHAQACHALGST